MKVSLNRIVVSGDNPRENFNEEEIKALGQNILEHGQIQPILLRPIPGTVNYELVVGERRLRACMAVGLPEIDADIRELTDYQAKEIRLIENIHRSDLSDAEKGDGFLALWRSADCPCETLKELAEKLQINYDTATTLWLPKAKKLSEKTKQLLVSTDTNFSDKHAQYLLKYPHVTQDKLAQTVINKKLTSRQLQELTRKHDANPKANLEDLADEVLGLPKTVTIPVTALTMEQKQAIQKEKENKPKPVQPKTKIRVHKIKPKKEKKITGPYQPQVLTIPELKLKTIAKIKHADALAFLNTVPDKSVDLLLTDPLYSTDQEVSEETMQGWLYASLNKLKDSGQAYIFTGAYAWELFTYLNLLKKVENQFGEPQILVWTYKNTIGPSSQERYQQNWQAIIYLRGPNASKIQEKELIKKFAVQEFNAPDGRLGIRFHCWEKPIELAKQLIQHSTKEGDLVIDPFAGTGTFLLAAAELDRKNLGCEIDSEMVEIAKSRGCVLG
jgi:ParB/RepB/Spo0J family partition protein